MCLSLTTNVPLPKIPYGPKAPQERTPKHHPLPTLREEPARLHACLRAHFARAWEEAIHFERILLECGSADFTDPQTERESRQLLPSLAGDVVAPVRAMPGPHR